MIAKLAIETIYPRASPLISLRDMGSKESGVRRQKKIKENDSPFGRHTGLNARQRLRGKP
jgi:hypothetical protein